jgi:hypothetical protein
LRVNLGLTRGHGSLLLDPENLQAVALSEVISRPALDETGRQFQISSYLAMWL